MFRLPNSDAAAKLEALDRSQAVIEFELDGTIVAANANFLQTLGYGLEEIRGRNHSMFVDQATRESAAYRDFWAGLRAGRFQRGEFLRIGKDGRRVWIQATYNPILDRSGKVRRVVKYAMDITAEKTAAADAKSRLEAIDRSQAVISFALDGTILDANKNFLDTLGYGIDEIRGRHHSMFVEPTYRESAEYRAFWDA